MVVQGCVLGNAVVTGTSAVADTRQPNCPGLSGPNSICGPITALVEAAGGMSDSAAHLGAKRRPGCDRRDGDQGQEQCILNSCKTLFIFHRDFSVASILFPPK